ncbi:MAG: HDOD domain-containing protein [Syntrophaceae bacterium]
MAEHNGSPFIQIVSDVVNALMTLVEEKDVNIRGHSERVAMLCLNLARRLKLGKRDCETIHLAGMLHDVGMVYIPDELIQKSDNLSESEQLIMRRHPVQAEKILSRISIFRAILPTIRHHHEHYDGSGYPDSLKADSIPLGSRIMCMADHFDRMTANLPGKPAMSVDEALIIIQDDQGSFFDPALVPEFIGMINDTYTAKQDKVENEDDVKKAVKKIISKFESGVIGLPVLPTIVEKIRETIAAPNYSIDALAKLLELDAVISVRLITVANSVVYRGREKVQTVRQAVPRLGTKETDNIVMAIVNRNLYQTDEKELQGLMENLWNHSLATAFCARLIAERLRLGEQESYFTLGLIHDLGKVPLLQGISTLRAKGDDSMKALDMTTISGILKDAHEALGAGLLKKWEFADQFVRVAQMHEEPAMNEKTEKSILVVHLANILTRTIGMSNYTDEGLNPAAIESARLLGLAPEVLTEIAQETKKLVEASANMF